MLDSRKNWAIVDEMSEIPWPDEMTARIAAEIKRLRGGRSGQWLSDRTAELGYRVSRSTISEIETGRRKSITLSDLIILAAALDTVPLALIYPGPYRDKIRVLPELEVPQIWGVRWFSGELSTFSDVPFDEEGRWIRVANASAYNYNLRRMQNARQAAKADQRKMSLIRELRRLQRAKRAGEKDVSDEEVQSLIAAIADYRREADFLNRYADGEVPKIAFESLTDELVFGRREAEEDADGR